jgi:hypothetical protein
MLRNVVLAIGGGVIAIALGAIAFGNRGGAIVAFVYACILVLALVYERVTYKRVLPAPPSGDGWARSEEKFIDPNSGKTLTVYTRAGTGERAYVADNTVPPASAP